MQGDIQNRRANRQYLRDLMQKYKDNQGNSYLYESVGNIIKKSQKEIQSQLQNGSLIVRERSQNDSQANILDHIAKKNSINPFQSHYRGFFISSDRQKSKQRLEIFKKIKQQYSKQKTTLVVKQVQKKIKEWAQMKTEIQKKKKHDLNKKQQIQFQMIEHMKRAELQRMTLQKQNKKQQLINRKRLMEQKRQKRQEFMKQSIVRSLDMKQPKYKQMQKKFNEIQQKQIEQRQRLLQQKRNSMVLNKQEIAQHIRKYEQLRKQKQEQRKSKLKYQIKDNKSLNKQQFVIFSNQDKEIKLRRKEKRKKMVQFGEKIKSLILNARNKQIQNIEEKERQLQQQKEKEEKEELQRRQKDIKQKIQHSKKLRVHNRTIDPQVNGRELGNNYLKQLKEQDKAKINSIKSMKILNESVSLPSIRPTYKNYLTEVKIKRKPIGDGEIQRLKRSCTSKQQLYQILNKKSSDYEESMMLRINELKKVNKYDESVVKQSEIDDMYSKCLKLKLACINV